MIGSTQCILAVASLLGPVAAEVFESNGLNFAFPNVSTPTPFHISVNSTFIDESLAKVRHYRPARDVWPEWTNEGPAYANITALATYWATEYDWSKAQKGMNSEFSHFVTTVDSGGTNYSHPIPLHFVHEKSHNKNATPLLLLHGWPSTHLEWSKVIKPLTRNGNTTFHVVAPDLPGFGFSPAPVYPGMGPREMGAAFDALMHQLGYDRYGIASTDLGWEVGMWMAGDQGSNVIGHFTDFFVLPPNATDTERFAANQTTPEETAYIIAYNAWATNHASYAYTHAQKPLAISLAMSDSPVGFAGWIWDLIDLGGPNQFTFEELVTTTMMVFIQGTYGNIRAYLESFNLEIMNFPITSVPTGVAEWGNANPPDPNLVHFPLTPRSWIERTVNVVYFSRHSFGGHFPAHTEPAYWIEDIKAFFSGL